MALKRVVVVGGTHGNEWGGIFLLRRELAQVSVETYPFQLDTCLANPGATRANRRYLDQDLNRSFVAAELAQPELPAYEAQRAQVLARELGDADFLLDLHNTTANMGLTLILSRPDALTDPLTRQLCAHALRQDTRVRLYTNPVPLAESPYLPSVARRDLTLEVGPMAHGTLRAELYHATRKLVFDLLDYLARWEKGTAPRYTGELPVYAHLQNVDYPRTATGELDAMVHPDLQDRDFEPLLPGAPLFQDFSSHTLTYQGSETVWPVFINEQAYYEKHFAMSLTRLETYPL
ncbi:MAG: aspartoacylase [Candidatus Sericytochromatia bacterium]